MVRLRDGGDGDPDLEGAAYDKRFFYAVGSHGRSRYANRPNDNSYAVFRFPVGKNGKPKFVTIGKAPPACKSPGACARRSGMRRA